MHLLKSLVSLAPALLIGSSVALTACGDDGGDDGGNEEEVITTLGVRFIMGAGAPLTFEFDDPDGDGGAAPTIDPIAVPAGTYAVSVFFVNRLETPEEDITAEVLDESDEHQVFFTGTAINGPATDQPTAPITHTYSDTDANNLPVGLANSLVAVAGTGTMTVTLRHLPPVNGAAAKTGALAAEVKAGGINSIAGSTDVSVNFPVTVTAP